MKTAKRFPEFATTYALIAKRREKIATIAIARKLLADVQAARVTAPGGHRR